MYKKVSTDMNFVEREKEVEKFLMENNYLHETFYLFYYNHFPDAEYINKGINVVHSG